MKYVFIRIILITINFYAGIIIYLYLDGLNKKPNIYGNR
jgi:hypothetical protein